MKFNKGLLLMSLASSVILSFTSLKVQAQEVEKYNINQENKVQDQIHFNTETENQEKNSHITLVNSDVIEENQDYQDNENNIDTYITEDSKEIPKIEKINQPAETKLVSNIYNETPIIIDGIYEKPLSLNEHTVSGDILFTQDMKSYGSMEKNGQQLGGIPRLASVASEARKQLKDPILAFGGDMLGGGLFSSFYGAIPYIEAFNEMGVDVSGFGSHEFDFDLPAVENMMIKANYPMIAANLTLADGNLLAQDGGATIVNSGDLKIGFISTTGEIASTPLAKTIKEENPVESIRPYIEDLENKNVDVIVLLTQSESSDINKMMKEFPQIKVALREENISDGYIRTKQGQYVLPGDEFTGDVLHVHIVKDRQTGKVSVSTSKIVVNEDIPNDPAYQEKLKHYEDEMSKQLDISIATASQDLNQVAYS